MKKMTFQEFKVDTDRGWYYDFGDVVIGKPREFFELTLYRDNLLGVVGVLVVDDFGNVVDFSVN